MKRLIHSIVLMIACSSSLLFSAPVFIDSTFGPNNNGTIITSYGDDDEAMDVIIQPDDKILVIGNSLSNRVYSIKSTRYLANGSIDTSFGTQGVGTFTAFNGLTVNSIINLGSLYLAVGSIMVNSDPVIGGSRFTSDGAVDSSFGSSGVASFSAYGIAENGAIQGEKLIMLINAGVVGNEQLGIYLVRINADASIDTTFGSSGDGIRKMPITGMSQIYAHSLYVGANYILVSGYINEYGGEKIFCSKFTSDGIVDTNFGTNGTVVTPFSADTQAHSHFIGLQSDNKIIVAGAAGCDFVVMRYTAAGVLDPTFGNQGMKTTRVGDCSHGYGATILSDDKIVVAGLGGDAIGVVKYTASGALDTTFGDDGVATAEIGSNSVAQALAVQSDGKIVVVGSSANKFAVARFRANNDDFLSISAPADGSTITSSTFTLSGNASESAATVRIKVDGTVVATATTDAFGNWNAGTSIIIADGSHTLLAELMDGESVVTSDSHTITVAASSAACSITTPAAGGILTSQTPTISGRASKPSASVKISVDGSVVATVTTDSLGAWSGTSTRLANGSHTVLAQLMNGATVLASDTKSCTVSVTPYVSFDTPTVGSTIILAITNIDGKCSEAGKTLHVLIDGNAFKKVTTSATGTWDAGSHTFIAGSHSILVFGVDSSGTMQMYASNFFTVNLL